MSSISSLVCVLTFIATTGCVTAVTYLHLDCGYSEQMCPSSFENVTLTCTTNSSFLLWTINNNYSIDFNRYTISNVKTAGPFVAKTQVTNSMILSTLQFDPSLVDLGTVVKCRDNVNPIQKQCQTKLTDLPSRPSNLSYYDSDLTLTLSWSPLNTSIDYYSVKLVGSNQSAAVASNNYTTNATTLSITLATRDIYTAHVMGVTCQGELVGEASSIVIDWTVSPSLFIMTVPTVKSTPTLSVQTDSFTITTDIISKAIASTTVIAITSIVPTNTTESLSANSATATLISTAAIISTTETITSTDGIENTSMYNDKPDETNWFMLIISGIVGAFVALLMVAVIGIIFICIYRMLCLKNSSTNPTPSSHFPPYPATYTTVSTAAQVDNDNIHVVYNPCYKTELSESSTLASDYPVPQFIRSLDRTGFSRTECV